jgi:hypothetical protein
MLTVSNSFVRLTDSTGVLAINKLLRKLVHKLGESLVNKRLIFQNLGHTPETTNRPDIPTMPVLILGVKQVTKTMAFNFALVSRLTKDTTVRNQD